MAIPEEERIWRFDEKNKINTLVFIGNGCISNRNLGLGHSVWIKISNRPLEVRRYHLGQNQSLDGRLVVIRLHKILIWFLKKSLDDIWTNIWLS